LKRILISIIAIVVLIASLGAGFAYFSDTETASNNTFTAGYMNLGINGTNNPSGLITLENMAPGHPSPNYNITFTNYGSLEGILSCVVAITGEPTEPNTMAPDGNGANVSAAC